VEALFSLIPGILIIVSVVVLLWLLFSAQTSVRCGICNKKIKDGQNWFIKEDGSIDHIECRV